MIPVGVFAKTFSRPSVYEVFRAVKEHSFEVAHFNFACAGQEALPDQIPPSAIERIRSAKADLSMELVGVSATFNMAHPDPARRRDGLRRLEVIAGSCSIIETNLITLCTGSRDPDDQWKFHPDNNSPAAWADLVRTMEAAVQIAEKYDVQLGIEPELANVVSTVDKAHRLLREMGSRRLNIILDPANLFEVADEATIKALIEEAIGLLGPVIAMAHAKDRNTKGDFVPPGQGVIPFDFFVRTLLQANIHCPLVAHGFSEEDAPAVANFLNLTVNYEQSH